MSSRSNSAQTNTPQTTTTVLNRDEVVRDGTLISGSIIVDPSDRVMSDLVGSLQANFRTLVQGQSAGTQDLANLARQVLTLVNKNQVQMGAMETQRLQAALDFMEKEIEQGRYIVDFASQAVNQSFGLANQALGNSNEGLQSALSLVADVKTGDFADTLKAMSGMIMVFSLAAIYLARKAKL